MKKYTRNGLKGLSKDALMVLYALNLSVPRAIGEAEIMKIIEDCKLPTMTEDELIGALIGN